MTGYSFALGLSLILIVIIAILLRKRRLREKYAAIWLIVATSVCVIGAFPRLAEKISNIVGVNTTSNLLFATAILVLLLVCVQLSVESSSLEEEARTLAEQLALLQHRVETLEQPKARNTSEMNDGALPTSPNDTHPST